MDRAGGRGQALALGVRRGIAGLDPRLRVLLCAAAGLAAWTLPWRILPLFLLAALLLAWTAWTLLPGGRGLLAACSLFSLFWGISWFFLHWWESGPETLTQLRPLLGASLVFSARLFALLGLGLAVPLSTTALTLGRVFAWYMRGPAWLAARLTGRARFLETSWRCGLALCIMAAFLPRAFRTLNGLRRSLALRAPRLPLRRRMSLLALAALRLLGTQTWDMALAIASRDLYREVPWRWR